MEMQTINNDPGTCLVCGGKATEWVEFKSKHHHTKSHFCLGCYTTFKVRMLAALRDMQEFIRASHS